MKVLIKLRGGLSVCFAVVGALMGFNPSAVLLAQEPAQTVGSELKIVVLEGEDGVNIIKKKTAVRPVVEVRDKNNLPVAGVTIYFALPGSGPSAVFANGTQSMTLVTDSAGRAAVAGMKPVGTGAFKIQVTASFHGQTASATISQTNYATAVAASSAGATTAGATAGGAGGLGTGAIVGIIAGVAAAVGIGVGVGVTRGGSSSTPASAGPHGSIGSPGSPTIGPPH